MSWPIRKGLAIICVSLILITPGIISLNATAYNEDGLYLPYTNIVFFKTNETIQPFNISLTTNNIAILPTTIGVSNEVAYTMPTTMVKLNTTTLKWKDTIVTVITPVYNPISPPGKPYVRITYTISVDRKEKELLLIIFVENIGDSIAKNVKVDLQLPNELKISSLEGGIEADDSKVVNWIGDLPPKEGHSIKFSFKYSGKATEDLELPLNLGYQDEYGNEWWFQLLIIIAKYLLELLLSKLPGFETITVILVLVAVIMLRKKKMYSKINRRHLHEKRNNI